MLVKNYKMGKKLFVGIDNGVSGTIGVVGEKTMFFKTPVRSVLKYTKKKANVTRIDHKKLFDVLSEITNEYLEDDIIIKLERPMVNPKRFTATSSALRAWEATLIVVELLGLPYDYIDSKEWQKEMLPSGIKGAPELKRASRDVGDRLFPSFKELNHEDRDGILIAEYLRKTYN